MSLSSFPVLPRAALAGALLALAPALTAQSATAVTAAPIRGYVYLEPFELRQEFVLELDAVLPTAATLDADAQDAALAELRPRLATACDLAADDEPQRFEIVQLQFVRIDPELGPVEDDRDEIPGAEAVVAAVLACDRGGFPKQLELTWRLFPRAAPGAEVPVEIEVTAPGATHSEQLRFAAKAPNATWRVPEALRAPRLLAVAGAREGARATPFVVAAAFLGLSIVIAALALRRRDGRRGGYWIAAALALVLAGGALQRGWRAEAAARVTEAEARDIVEALLCNVYHAFAHRDESAIFDTLAASVDGPLLEQLYLDIRRGLDVEEAGGPRVKVADVSLVTCELQRSESGGLRAGVVWVSQGTVSHWGHAHDRRNQYRGELDIAAIDGRWKLTDVEILDEERT